MMPPASKDQTTPTRKAISRRLRYEILRRDNYTCRFCRATDQPLTIDHLVPVALGGTDDPSNLVAACKDCNAGKSSSSPDAATVAQVDDDAVRWSRAVLTAAQRALRKQEELMDRLEPFHDYWYSLVPNYKLGDWRWELPNNWASVIAGLLAGGLPDPMVTEAMRIALTTRGVDERFRYFLGITRNQLAELHQQAAEILAAEDAPPTVAPDEPEKEAPLGWSNRAWRKGYLKALEHIRRAESGDRLYWESAQVSAFQYGALAMVVDAGAMDWAS